MHTPPLVYLYFSCYNIESWLYVHSFEIILLCYNWDFIKGALLLIFRKKVWAAFMKYNIYGDDTCTLVLIMDMHFHRTFDSLLCWYKNIYIKKKQHANRLLTIIERWPSFLLIRKVCKGTIIVVNLHKKFNIYMYKTNAIFAYYFVHLSQTLHKLRSSVSFDLVRFLLLVSMYFC